MIDPYAVDPIDADREHPMEKYINELEAERNTLKVSLQYAQDASQCNLDATVRLRSTIAEREKENEKLKTAIEHTIGYLYDETWAWDVENELRSAIAKAEWKK